VRAESLGNDPGRIRFRLGCRAIRFHLAHFLDLSAAEDFGNAQLAIELLPGHARGHGTRLADAAAVLRNLRLVTDVVEFVRFERRRDPNAVIYVSLVPRSARSMSQKQWSRA